MKNKKEGANKGKDTFLRVYANLSMDLREEIILVIDKPITWNIAYEEISRDTEFGKKILKKLIEMGFI